MSTTTVIATKLIERFEQELRLGSGTIPDRCRKSEARQDILEAGRTTFTAIGKHVRDRYVDKSLSDTDRSVLDCWKTLLFEALTQPPPMDTDDLKRWVAACFVEGGAPN